MEDLTISNSNVFDDPMIQEALQQAMKEVREEEALSENQSFDKDIDGIQGFETEDNFLIEQDISGILEDAKIERDARDDGLIKAEKGSRKFATVPIAVIIDYANKTGIDIMGDETSRDKWEMSKFRMWIQKNHPELMVRKAGKTKFHLTT